MSQNCIQKLKTGYDSKHAYVSWHDRNRKNTDNCSDTVVECKQQCKTDDLGTLSMIHCKCCLVKPKFHLPRHVTTRTMCRARRDERVAPCCPTSATRHITFPYAKMHGLDSLS